jgi:hypothetical protein
MKSKKTLKELNNWIKENPKDFEDEILAISTMIQKEEEKIPVELKNISYTNYERYINGFNVHYCNRNKNNNVQILIFYIIDSDNKIIEDKDDILNIQNKLSEEGYINYIQMHGNHIVKIIDKT